MKLEMDKSEDLKKEAVIVEEEKFCKEEEEEEEEGRERGGKQDRRGELGNQIACLLPA